MQTPPRFTEEKTRPSGKNKMVLILLSGFLGFLGVDRLYMRCYREAFMKFFLFVGGLLLLFVSPPIGAIMLLINILWTIMDQILVLFNALVESTYVPATFCKSPGLRWASLSDIRNGKWLAVFVILVNVFTYSGGINYFTMNRLGETVDPGL